MAKEDTQVQKTPREQLREMARSKFQDRNFPDQEGQTAQEGQDDLDQAILDIITEANNTISENASKNEKMVKLFYGDPKSGEFVNRWIETGDPRAALIEVFGDELAELGTEEGRMQFSDNLKSYRDRQTENQRLNDEAQANWDKSLADLDEWGNAKGLPDEKKAEVAARLLAVTAKGLMNIYEPADFDMVYKEMNYDNDVAAARQEGEVAGRNAKIAAARRERSNAGAMPPALSGQGVRSAEPTPAKPESPWAGIK